jgi:methyltransferase
MILPGAQPINHGIYRFIRHPNYLGVILEIGAVPLLHSAYLTAIVFSIANALLLAWRIRTEETALKAHNSYEQIFADRPRFLPKI